MILTQQLKELVEDVKGDLTNGIAGTDQTLFDKSQGGVITPVADTNITLSDKTNTNSSVSVSHVITTALGNGSTLVEFETNNGAASYNRSVKAGLAKTSRTEYTIFHTFTFEIVP